MKEETIADIVTEMRNHASGSAESAWYTPKSWAKLCDRIEAAHEHWTAAICAEVGAAYQKELMRKNFALQPVMECDCKVLASRQLGDKWFTMSDDEFVKLCKVTEAVRKSQEIMKGEK